MLLRAVKKSPRDVCKKRDKLREQQGHNTPIKSRKKIGNWREKGPRVIGRKNEPGEWYSRVTARLPRKMLLGEIGLKWAWLLGKETNGQGHGTEMKAKVKRK